MDTKILASVEKDVSELRANFKLGKNAPKANRIKHLMDLQRMLKEGRDILCDAVRADFGRNPEETYILEINQIEHEIQHQIDHLDAYMAPEQVGTNILNIPGWSYIKRDPLGVALIMGTWNYPIQLALLPMVGALAAGNCVLLKVPSDTYTAKTSKALSQLCARYLDRDVIRVTDGDRRTNACLFIQRFDIIFFTGGVNLGKIVAAAAAKHLTPCILELGGKSPAVIDKTADLTVAAKRLIWGSMMNSGQTCVRPDYFVVHEKISKAFIAKLKEVIVEFYGEVPKKSEWYPRLINQKAFDRLNRLIQASQKYVVHGGAVDRSERFVEPTILDFGDDWEAFISSAAMQDEVFGPLIPIVSYSDVDKVINYINDGEKPLSCYVFSTDSSLQKRFENETSSGSLDINEVILHMSNHELPFGGVGHSGMGGYHGKHSFDAFSHKKAILAKTNWLDVWFRYPPYTPTRLALGNFVQAVRPSWQLKFVGRLIQMAVVFLVYTNRSHLAKLLRFIADLICCDH